MRPVYAIQVNCTPGAAGVVRLNGVPLIQWQANEGISTTRKVNMWTWKGLNRVSLRLRAGEEVEEAAPAIEAQVRFVRFDEDKLDAPPLPLTTGAFPPLAAPGAAVVSATLPYDRILPVEVPDAPPGQYWNQAKSLELGPSDLLDVRNLVRGLCQACSARDWNRVRDLLQFKARETAMALYVDPDQGVGRQVEFLQTMLEDPSLRVLVPADDELRAEVVADGKAMWVFVGAGEAALRFIAAGSESPRELMHVYVGKVNNVWTIVR